VKHDGSGYPRERRTATEVKLIVMLAAIFSAFWLVILWPKMGWESVIPLLVFLGVGVASLICGEHA